MTPSKFLLYLTCLLLVNMVRMNVVKKAPIVHQKRSYVSADVGENLVLQCLYGDDAARYYWYIQRMGKKLEVICVSYKKETNGTFYGDFKDNPRFRLETEAGQSQFKISNVQLSDTATYFCSTSLSFVFVFEFGEGTTVWVKDSGFHIQALVHQSESGSIQPAGSATLSCTVYNGTCDGEHSVYWFKDSKKNHPELIYTHGDGNGQCERKTHTCVYNLLMENLNMSNAETYYCAVASCGHILFGKGTKLDVKSELNSLHLVYILSFALTFTTILNAVLVFLLRKLYKRGNSQTESQVYAHSAANAEGYQDAADLHYAAVNVHLPNRPRRQSTKTRTECIYSVMKQ
ncbi:uncharacterized protein LOC121639326 [Melanotaenia boesemani]|uniref:uncharacterized protein LOC121639326 n=1 Tax=Melanotaenia boesemani TaxID=1250792 RepID=UPI001C050424|nr:uncharacterized protein LOC121639326 [Melanotaenia boesemani]